MAAHRYWRVRSLTVNGSPNGASEVEFRETIGGPTVTTGGAAISSGDYSGGYDKHFAFDGDGTNGHEWAANSDAGSWIGYDFGAGNEKDINEVAYKARQFYESQTPNVAVLEFSDDAAAWTVKFVMKFGTFANNETKVRSAYAAPPAGGNPHKFWRINFLADTGLASGREGELRGSPGGADLTDSLPIAYSDSGHYSDWDFSRMFDGDLDRITAISGGWGQAQFFDPVTIEEFVWHARNGGGSNYQVPLYGNVAYSDDGVAWTVYWTWDSTPGWADNETKTFTNPGYSAPIGRRRAAIVVC